MRMAVHIDYCTSRSRSDLLPYFRVLEAPFALAARVALILALVPLARRGLLSLTTRAAAAAAAAFSGAAGAVVVGRVGEQGGVVACRRRCAGHNARQHLGWVQR
jgi:hypothetical protein